MRSRTRFFAPLRALVGSLALLACLAAAVPARAEDPPAAAPAGGNEWQPVQTQMIQPGESFEAKNLVAAAYGFIWLMVAGFVFTVWRRADRLEKEIEALRAQVKQKTGGTTAK